MEHKNHLKNLNVQSKTIYSNMSELIRELAEPLKNNAQGVDFSNIFTFATFFGGKKLQKAVYVVKSNTIISVIH